MAKILTELNPRKICESLTLQLNRNNLGLIESFSSAADSAKAKPDEKKSVSRAVSRGLDSVCSGASASDFSVTWFCRSCSEFVPVTSPEEVPVIGFSSVAFAAGVGPDDTSEDTCEHFKFAISQKRFSIKRLNVDFKMF